MPHSPGANQKKEGVAASERKTPTNLFPCAYRAFLPFLMWRRAVAAGLRPARARTATSLPPCPYTPPPYDGPPVAEVLALRQRYLNPGERERERERA